MFEETVNGRRVVANDPDELAEAVAAVKAEVPVVAPDINDPKDGNKVVSPENTHRKAAEELAQHKDVSTDPPQPEEPQSQDFEEPEAEEPKQKKSTKKK